MRRPPCKDPLQGGVVPGMYMTRTNSEHKGDVHSTFVRPVYIGTTTPLSRNGNGPERLGHVFSSIHSFPLLCTFNQSTHRELTKKRDRRKSGHLHASKEGASFSRCPECIRQSYKLRTFFVADDRLLLDANCERRMVTDSSFTLAWFVRNCQFQHLSAH